MILAALMAAACFAQPAIEHPSCESSANDYFSVCRVVLSDTAAVLEAYNRPGDWVMFPSAAVLKGRVTGTVYRLVRSEDFPLDRRV